MVEDDGTMTEEEFNEALKKLMQREIVEVILTPEGELLDFTADFRARMAEEVEREREEEINLRNDEFKTFLCVICNTMTIHYGFTKEDLEEHNDEIMALYVMMKTKLDTKSPRR